MTGSMQDRSHVRARRRLSPLTAPAAFLAACGLLLNLVPPRAAQAQTGPRPNILVILTDDQRAEGTLGVMPKTRKLFVAGGTIFKNAVATTPLCCPSRASILSGRYAHNHGVTDNFSAGLLDQRKTMQKELQASGYLTAATGKFLNGWRKDPSYFDRWAIYSPPPRYFGATFRIDGVVREVPGYSTTALGQLSLDILNDFEAQDDSPWFMQVAPFAPHGPARPDTRYAFADVPERKQNPALREEDISDKPFYVQATPAKKWRVRDSRRQQLRTLMSVDDMVAGIFSRLEEMGEADNTLAIFMSDNGFLWYEHQSAGKGEPYDESVEIPLLARWPGHIPAGAKSRRIVANIDVAATAYAAAGVEPGYRVDGKPLFDSDRPYIFLEYLLSGEGAEIPRWHSLWTPNSSFIRYFDAPESYEYYSPADPWQLTNLYGDGIAGNEPSRETRLLRRLRRSATCAGRSCK